MNHQKALLEEEQELSKHGRYLVCGELTEGGFSWQRCELCNQLPGNRYDIVSIIPGKGPEEHIEYSACEDCLQYVANGELCHPTNDEGSL
jgi:hypothetical protein